ncbi:MAG: radical SAM protein [Desulfobacteraceae bacterium]
MNGIHILLTYKCNFECDHCFLYSGPFANGTMTLSQIRSVLKEAQLSDNVEWIYFEGGEPFLYYPLMLEGIRLAKRMGFKVGIVTNAYFAISVEDAELWLKPLNELGVNHLSISDDTFHYGKDKNSPGKRAVAAAHNLGISTASICIEKPFVEAMPGQDSIKGNPVIGGGAMFKGRAVEKLTSDLPHRPWQELSQCPHEDLVSPSRVHVDPFGHVHLCQGVSMGNMWQQPLSLLIAEYKAESNPICAALSDGGPALLARKYGVDHNEEYIDECHFCYSIRRTLIDRFPEFLTPRQVYGLETH